MLTPETLRPTSSTPPFPFCARDANSLLAMLGRGTPPVLLAAEEAEEADD